MTRSVEVLINGIARHYGFDNRSILLIEEMSELTKAITKYSRVRSGGKDMAVKIDKVTARANIAEEMADVLIMIQEIQELLGISDSEVSDIIWTKVGRTLDLIRREM